jgi:hypothetical protein
VPQKATTKPAVIAPDNICLFMYGLFPWVGQNTSGDPASALEYSLLLKSRRGNG